MPTPVIMPKFGMSQEEATIVSWRYGEGDPVEKGEPILEVETDKTIMEVEAPASGVLAGIRVQTGAVVPVTQVIAYILAPGEALPEAGSEPEIPESGAAGTGRSGPRATPLARRVAETRGIDLQHIPVDPNAAWITRQDVERFLAPGEAASSNDKRVRATPAARRLARVGGLDLTGIDGSGPRGRIQASDVSAALEGAGIPEGLKVGSKVHEVVVVPLEGIRRKIAQRMQQSYQTAPHITFSVEVDMDASQALLASLNVRAERSGEARLSVTALLVKAAAWALSRHPWVNASLVGEDIHLYGAIHVGVAVARPEGLIVPVIKHAGSLSLGEIASRLEDLVARARDNRLLPDDVSEGTFTISNLGMFGIKEFTAIINPPQSAILAVGAIEKVVRVLERETGDELVVRPAMTLTLSADHRVMDGAQAAAFLRDLADSLEDPALLLY